MSQKNNSDLIKIKTSRARYLDHMNSRANNTLQVRPELYSDYINILNGGIRYYMPNGNIYNCDVCEDSVNNSNIPRVFVTGGVGGHMSSGSGITPRNGIFRWATGLTGYLNEFWRFATDLDDNTYITGDYKSPYVIYNSNISSSNITALPVSSTKSIPIIKFNSDGQLVNAYSFKTNSASHGNFIITDVNNNKYICGGYAGNSNTSLFYSSNGTITSNVLPTFIGANTPLLFKYDANDNFVWATALISSQGSAQAVVNDNNNDILMYTQHRGYSNTQFIFNSNMSSIVCNVIPTTLSAAGTSVIKYSKDGIFQYACSLVTDSSNIPQNISIDTQNNFYINGRYSGTSNNIKIYNSNISSQVSNVLPTVSGGLGAYTISFNSNGVFRFACALNSTGINNSVTSTVDNFGNIYMTGYYNGSSGSNNIKVYSSNQSSIVSNILPTCSGNGGYIIKFNSNGEFQQAKSLIGTTVNTSWYKILNDGYIFTGEYSGSSNSVLYYTSNINIPISNILPSISTRGSYAIRCDNNDNVIYSLCIDGSGSENDKYIQITDKYIYTMGIYAPSTSNNIYVYGSNFTSNNNVIPSSGSYAGSYLTQFLL